MMNVCYSNDGTALRLVDEDYAAQEGEVVFQGYATPAQLEEAFPGHQAATAANARQIAQAPAARRLADLDARRSRALSDVALGKTEATGTPPMTPLERLAAIEEERAALAQKLA